MKITSRELSRLPASAFLLVVSVGTVRKNRGSTATFFFLAGSHSSRFTCSEHSGQMAREADWKEVAFSASQGKGGAISVREGVWP